MRRAAKVDANQAVIVTALRRCGAFVQDLSRVGGGCPDLLVGFRKRWLLMEVKDGDKPPSERKLTPDQERWHALTQGLPVFVVTSILEAVQAIQQLGPDEVMGLVMAHGSEDDRA